MAVTVSQKWLDNQADDVSVAGVVDGYMETVVDNLPNGWTIDNTTANNLITLDTTREFDYSRTSLPLSTTTAVIDNGSYNYEPNADYDFSTSTVKAKADKAGIVKFSTGYHYDDDTIEEVPWTCHVLDSVAVGDDDSTVTINASSSLGALDNGMYYRGKFYKDFVTELGMTAYDVIDDILSSQQLSIKGYYNYILGQPNCKTSETQALWTPYTVANYTIDTALKSVMIYTPVPPCTYRQALTMVCAYVGAYVLEQRDGSLLITTTLPAPSDYVFDETTVYDRPKRINGRKIKDCSVTLTSAYYDSGAAETLLYDGTITLAAAGQPQVITITHDPVAGVEPDAWMANDAGTVSIGDPTYTGFYGVYSTVVRVIPTGTSRLIRYTLYGAPLSLTTSSYSKTYNDMGESVTIDCGVASDPTPAIEMMDKYVDVISSASYEFTMRDDPSLDVGMRVWLKLSSEKEYSTWNYVLGEPTCIVSNTVPLQTINYNTLVPVVIQKIKSTFNGGMEATYTVITDNEPRV